MLACSLFTRLARRWGGSHPGKQYRKYGPDPKNNQAPGTTSCLDPRQWEQDKRPRRVAGKRGLEVPTLLPSLMRLPPHPFLVHPSLSALNNYKEKRFCFSAACPGCSHPPAATSNRNPNAGPSEGAAINYLPTKRPRASPRLLIPLPGPDRLITSHWPLLLVKTPPPY